MNGITTGYQGEGAKTVIPSKASAKVSMRLVPNQDPAKIRDAFERAIRERCPAGVKVEFKNFGLAEPLVGTAGSSGDEAGGRGGKGRLLASEPTFMRG